MLSAESRQLTFVFADNPQGGKNDKPADVSAGKAFLLHQASAKEVIDPATPAVEDTGRLLERAASVFNLSRALLNVARNKGAAGVDGRSVEQVVDDAPPGRNSRRLTLNRTTDTTGIIVLPHGGGHRFFQSIPTQTRIQNPNPERCIF